MVFAKIEFGKEGIWHEEIAEVIYPVSLALWRVGKETPVVVLEGRKEGMKQWNYAPVHWLPDGRLVVSATLGWLMGRSDGLGGRPLVIVWGDDPGGYDPHHTSHPVAQSVFRHVCEPLFYEVLTA